MNVARSKSSIPLALALLAACGSAHDLAPATALGDDGATPTLDALAAAAVDADTDVADAAITALRTAGPAGLEALLVAHADAVARLRTAPLTADAAGLAALRADPELTRVRTAIDRVAAQRDAFASGLYWYTDLAEAEAEAARSARPILSLRLLGRLDEEASCANSRFFRWLLYPNPIVRQALAGYVLHWSSERPAPHVTIDMGDGRTLERTITGNSIHYVLDASGHVIDAIAGLHAPDDFVRRLEVARGIAERCGVRDAGRACVATEHQQLLAETQREWTTIVATSRGLPDWDGLLALDTPTQAAPPAVVAMPLTVGKMAIEMPMLRLIGAASSTPPPAPIAWASVAPLAYGPAYDEVLSEPSRSLARLKSGRVDDDALLRATYDRAVADTLQNRFTLDRRLHAWLAAPEIDCALDALNVRVYAELFLTPASDPWLGLQTDSDWDVMEAARP